MGESSASSLTSTSHTLTIGQPMASGAAFPSLSDISSALAFRDAIRRANRQAFLKPQLTLPTASTQFAQVALGSFAGQVSDEQQERLRLQHAANALQKKRKRMGQAAGDDTVAAAKQAGPVGPLLKVRRVHVDGFEVPQIWQQSNRIISVSLSQAKHELERLDEEDEEDEESEESGESEAGVVSEEEEADENEDEEEEEEEEDEEDEGEEEDEEEDELAMDGEDDLDEDLDISQEFVEDKDGLNDGFFDINEFNKKSQFFEDQDARADPNTDLGSDDEEFDWHADPFAAPKPGKKGKAKGKAKGKGRMDESDDEAEEEEEDEDEAPLFGDMDLETPWGDSDAEPDDDEEHDGGLESGLAMDLGGEDLYYKDFFAPPPKKRGDRRDGDRDGDRAPVRRPFQPEEQEVRRAMADVKRDLFEQISEASESEDDGIEAEEYAGAGGRGRSTHERHQSKILAEIRRLEAEAVKEKDWTLSGEASAGARPLNSLLEEDLEFEHTGKPVPVITQEVNEDMEALVKRRILSQEFDEVRRRYATQETEAARRGLVEIDDQPGKKSLAALYEEEHLKETHADTYVSASDEQRQAEERAVEQMWQEVSAKLDALSSWHYKPRPAAPTLTVVADVGTVAMEDAQPATAQGVSGGASMLAPQEVYKPGTAPQSQDKDVVTVAKSGLPVARDEMTREDKARRRRRNKERIRKSGSGMPAAEAGEADKTEAGDAGKKSKAAERQDTLAALKKGGVKVIGRRGEIEDLDGNKAQTGRAVAPGNFKL